MNLLRNFDTSFFTVTNFARLGLLFGLVFYTIFALLVVRQVGILNKAVQTEDGLFINLAALFLLLLGGLLLIWVVWLVFF
jgi:hypothetical protein